MKAPKVTQGFLSPTQCDSLVATCESAKFSQDSNHKEYTQATVDLEVDRCPAVRDLIVGMGIAPKISEAIRVYCGQDVTCFNDLFVVKYNAKEQRALENHTDAGDVSFMLALSSRSSYKGGGTEFEDLKEEGPLHLEQGSSVVFDAGSFHTGLPITSGRRYLLVAFCYVGAEASREAGNLSISTIAPLHGNRNSFDMFEMVSFDVKSIKGSVKSLAKLGKSAFVRRDSKTLSPLGAFVLAVFEFHVRRLGVRVGGGGGVECWSQRLDVNKGDHIPWHRDKDEGRLARGGGVRHPLVSTVTYLTDNDTMVTTVFGENNTLAVLGREGQHLAFDGKMLHGVIPLLQGGEESGGQKKRRKKRKRLTLLINLWLEPPDQKDFVEMPGCAEGRGVGDDLKWRKAMWEEMEVEVPTIGKDGSGEEDPDRIVEQVKGISRTTMLVSKVKI